MAHDTSSEKSRVTGVFDRAAATYDRVGPRFFSHFGQRLIDLAQIAPGHHVLDVAAGRGAVLFPAAERVGSGGRVVGIDFSEEMVRATSAEITRWPQAAMRRMDAEHLDFPDATFDRVVCGFALWFFPNPPAALLEFLRVLRPGGSVTLTTWANDNPAQLFSRSVLRPYMTATRVGAGNPDAPQYNTLDQLRAGLEQAGFSGVRAAVEERDFVYGNGDDWWATLWSMGIRNNLEKLDAPTLEKVKADGFKQLEKFRQPDGFHLTHRALVGFGSKPR